MVRADLRSSECRPEDGGTGAAVAGGPVSGSRYSHLTSASAYGDSRALQFTSKYCDENTIWGLHVNILAFGDKHNNFTVSQSFQV